MPKKLVDQVITDHVLKRDKVTCDNMLNIILQEKQDEDRKRNIRAREKMLNRNKTVLRHNKQLSNMESIGVKIKSPS